MLKIFKNFCDDRQKGVGTRSLGGAIFVADKMRSPLRNVSIERINPGAIAVASNVDRPRSGALQALAIFLQALAVNGFQPRDRPPSVAIADIEQGRPHGN